MKPRPTKPNQTQLASTRLLVLLGFGCRNCTKLLETRLDRVPSLESTAMRPRRRWVLLTIASVLSVAVLRPSAQTPARATAPPAATTGFDLARLARIDDVVREAIAAKKLPGAVVVVGRGDTIVWRKAYGDRAVRPSPEPMTLDTIFDMASLTKVVATTPAVMKLVEDGKIRLTDPVASFIPEFGKYGKDRVTVRDLLTHTSGLRPDLDLGDDWSGYDTGVKLATEEVLSDRRFVYSDINFLLLAEIVARVSKQPFDEFVKTQIFAPLGMRETMFKPPAALVPRIAPTQACASSDHSCGGQLMLRGVVHDPTARRMGGVAGHAGLFSTAADLTIYCRALLGGGAVGQTRVLAPLTVARMTSPASPAGDANVRGLGWDLDSSYSANRGELLPLGSYGHTGFTGTSIWIDPATRVFIVFLSNRVHPDGTGDVTPLRARVATIVASSLTGVTSEAMRALAFSRQTFASQVPAVAEPPAAPVQTGIDVLRASGFAALKGLKVGLVTNHTGRARDGAATIDLLAAAPGVTLVSLFSPEHGIRGILDARVPTETDEKTGKPIHSLYGATERPTSEMLAGLDAIVIDLQDIGARFYTYMTTMAYVMEEASSRKIKVFVLDRPNPIGGVQIEGPGDGAADRRVHQLPSVDADSPRFDDGRAGEAVQRREEDGRGSDGRRDEELAPRRVVRRDRPGVGEPVAQHAHAVCGDGVPGARRIRDDEHLGRARHRHALPADRRAVDRRPASV